MKKKILISAIVVLSLALLVAVGGTMAWLFDSTSDIVNTFSPTDVDVDLNETWNYDSDGNGSLDSWKVPMLPGASYVKDPVVTVSADSVDCYVFVKVVESGNASTYLDYTIDTNGWTALETTSADGTTTTVLYRVSKVGETREWHMLDEDTITVNSTAVNKGNMDTASEASITFTAYACQLYKANGTVFSAAEAWTIATGGSLAP